MRYYTTPIRMATISKKKPKNKQQNKCWQQCVEIVILLYCWWDYKMVQLL